MSSSADRDKTDKTEARPRVSQITEAATGQRSARRLLADQLGLMSGQRLLVLLGEGTGLEQACGIIEAAAADLSVQLTVLDTRTLSLASEVERRAWRETLSRCHACVLLGGEGRPSAERLESEVRVQTGGKPLAILRVDPDALLHHGLMAPTVLQRAYARYLVSRLASDAEVAVCWHGAPALILRVEHTRTARPRSPVADFEFPHGHVAVGLETASGQLARPTSILLPAPPLDTRPPQGFQFHGGQLRAVVGTDGPEWLGEVSRRFPGMRLRTLGFGLISPQVSSIERAGVRLSDVGCTLTVVDARQRGVSPSDAAYTGLTFCLNGPGLDVDIDGVAILRGGRYVEPSAAY